jgi:hypothetical protein
MEANQLGMRSRVPAQSIIEKLFEEHDRREQQSTFDKLFGFAPLHAEDKSWHTGALGERVVASYLRSLPPSWHVFHSLPIGRNDSDIDHVVVGPGGLFSINTKHHHGKKIWVAGKTLRVNGQPQYYIQRSESEAKQLTEVLAARGGWVPDARGVVAILGSASITVRNEPSNVKVLSARGLTRWLAKRPPALEPEEVRRLASILDDPATWRPTAPADTTALNARFDHLSRWIARASAIQMLWKVGFVVILAWGFFGLVLPRP